MTTASRPCLPCLCSMKAAQLMRESPLHRKTPADNAKRMIEKKITILKPLMKKPLWARVIHGGWNHSLKGYRGLESLMFTKDLPSDHLLNTKRKQVALPWKTSRCHHLGSVTTLSSKAVGQAEWRAPARGDEKSTAPKRKFSPKKFNLNLVSPLMA